MTQLTWVKNEAGEWASGDYRIVRKSGYCDVFYSGDKINEYRTSLKDCKQIAQTHADKVEWAMIQADKGIGEANVQAEAILDEVAELERAEQTPEQIEEVREESFLKSLEGATEEEIESAYNSVKVRALVPTMPAMERNVEASKTPEQVREILGLIVDQFGADIPSLELPGILVRHGLSTDDVTPGLLRQIGRERREKLRQGFREFNEKAKESGSGRRIVMAGDAEFDPDLNPKLPGFAQDRAEQKARQKEEHRKRLEELRARKEGDLDHPGGNGKLSLVDDSLIQPSPEEEGVMNVKEKAARNLLVAMGYAEATDKKKWPKERLQKELNDPKSLMEDAKEVIGRDLEMLDMICKALDGGGKVKVISGAAPASGKAGRANKDKANPKQVNGRAKGSKAKSNKDDAQQGTDKYGSRLGSNRAKVNACLSKKPKTPDQLAEEAGLPNAYFRKHLKSLVERKMVVVTDDGYRLA